jgi:hypothetical protein
MGVDGLDTWENVSMPSGKRLDATGITSMPSKQHVRLAIEHLEDLAIVYGPSPSYQARIARLQETR